MVLNLKTARTLGLTLPLLLARAGHNYNYVSKQIADAIWREDWKRACVSGDVALSRSGSTFVYFTKAWAVSSRAETKCSEQGL
jgi:hypothetical protein